MSQIYKQQQGGGGGSGVQSLTGNDLVKVLPDALGNINVVGDGITATVTGTPGTHTELINILFNPNKVVELIDDFLPSSTLAGQLSWVLLSSSTVQIDSTATNPGLFQIGTDVVGGMALSDSVPGHKMLVVGGGTIQLNFVVNLFALSSASHRYRFFIGLSDKDDGSAPTNGIYFSYTDTANGGKWLLNCTSASVTTSVDSGVAATTNFVNFGISINAAGTSVSFQINGSTVGSPITTNIPSTGTFPTMLQIQTSGTLPGSLIDLFYMKYVLTAAR